MSRGPSGRIVLDINPQLKKEMHARERSDDAIQGVTKRANDGLLPRRLPALFAVHEPGRILRPGVARGHGDGQIDSLDGNTGIRRRLD